MAFLKEDNSYSHVIAIDFGTGASGYGIAPMHVEPGSGPRIDVMNPCEDGDDQKTPTCILFSDDGDYLAFGSEALARYAEMVDDGETGMLFQNYKLHLLKLDQNAVAVDGREMPLINVISDSLRVISERAIHKLSEQIGKVSPQKIRWVLTVPALWTEDQKQFMRRACLQANIIEELNSTNLLLCLEPEGASIQSREEAEPALRSQMIQNSVCMVLDCGGGTVDITVHKLLCNPEEQFVCDELLPSDGGTDWGSKFVDEAFEKFLAEFLGKELTEKYYLDASARLGIMKHFELLKRKFNPGHQERSRLQFSYMGEELTQKKIQELVNAYNDGRPQDHHLKLRGASAIDLPPELMKSFFLPLFIKIENKAEELIVKAAQIGHPINFMFLVGGFSESAYLKAEIKKKFENENMHILVPKRPQVSVIRGACMFGLNPRSITSRISHRTYGINTLTTFDPEKHAEEKKVVIEGEYFCEDVFDAFVKKGQPVGIDEVHVKTYCPVRSRQTVMRIIFYATDKENIMYIDDQGVERLGELSIDIGRPFQSVEDKTVKVTLVFGSTAIQATATNSEGTEIRKSEFKFDSLSTCDKQQQQQTLDMNMKKQMQPPITEQTFNQNEVEEFKQ